MAKRRNLKKEKALRNQAYARKFRKRNTGRFGRRFNNYQNNRQENSNEQDQENQDSNATASDNN